MHRGRPWTLTGKARGRAVASEIRIGASRPDARQRLARRLREVAARAGGHFRYTVIEAIDA
jgi:hypothetical protein